MARPDFDVIIAGAGAGGAAAAYYLTTAGMSVLVVEKARLPRYKACGGAIPRPTLDRFPLDFGAIIRAAPSSVRFTFPGLAAVDVPLRDRPIVMVMRSEFDSFLLSQSQAEVMDGTSVTNVAEADDHVRVEAGARAFTARYLIGADGATSQVARCLGLRSGRSLGGTLEAEVPTTGRGDLQREYGNRAVFALGVVPWGYAWVFPKGDHLSVGVGRFRPGRVDLRKILYQEMDHLGIQMNGVALHGHALPCYRARPWSLERRSPQEKLSSRRCLLVGDAAGLTEPLAGEGIRYAIASAHLAAQAIVDDDLDGYESAIWQRIGHSLATAGLMASTFHQAPHFCFSLGVRNPATIQHLTQVLTEQFSYEGIGRRLLAITARWLVGGRAEQMATDGRGDMPSRQQRLAK